VRTTELRTRSLNGNLGNPNQLRRTPSDMPVQPARAAAIGVSQAGATENGLSMDRARSEGSTRDRTRPTARATRTG